MGKHNKDLPARPSGSRERERHRSKERTEAIRDRSRSRAPSNSSAASSSVQIPDYYLQDPRSTPPLPAPASRRVHKEEPSSDMRSNKSPSQPNTLQKPRRKDANVPKLTIRKPEEREYYSPEVQSATAATPGNSSFGKFGRGRPKAKDSPTMANYPRTPREVPPNPSSPPPPMPQQPPRRPSEPPSSSGSGQRSSSTDGRITTQLKASKAAIQSQSKKWTIKGQNIWGKLSSKNPKSAVFAPPSFGTFPSKPTIDVVGMPLPEATIKTRVAKELVPGVDASAYWLPAMAYRLISYLNVHGPKEQGIYRVPGSTAAVDKMREEFSRNYDFDLFQDPPDDVNTASSLLKSFIRSLPEPILPPKFQEDLYEKVRDDTNAKQPPQVFVDMLSSLPPQNYYLLQVLTNHLSNVRLAEDVTKMGLSNLAMIFCSTMKMDRYIFHWLVGSWSDCWGGCWAAEEMASNGPGSVRVSFDTRSETSRAASSSRREEPMGLGIRSNDGRSYGSRSRGGPSQDGRSYGSRSDGRRNSQELDIPLPPLPTPREPSPSASTIGKSSSRKRMSGIHDAPDTAQDPERGRKRTSRETDWPAPPTPATIKQHRRLSSAESMSSMTGNASFGAAGATIRQVPRESREHDPLSPRINELIGSFRMKARERRSVDVSQLAILAQQASLQSPSFPPMPSAASSPKLQKQGPIHASTEPIPPRQPLSPRNASLTMQSSPKPTQGQQRARSAERSAQPREVELLPPMPPLSPLLAGPNYGHF